MVDDILASLETWLNETMPWMFWKGEVALFLICFFGFLTILAIISTKKKSNPKSGILKIPTTLGDKVFISAVLTIAIMLVFVAIDLPWFLIIVVAAPVILIIITRG